MNNAAFMVDGGLEMGMGHVYRSLILADEIKKNAEIAFLTKSDEIVLRKIRDSNFKAYEVSGDSEALAKLRKIDPDVVIIDKLDVETAFARELKNSTHARLVVFENLIEGSNKYIDVLINAVMGAGFKNNRFYDESNDTLFLYGPKYFVFKPSVYEFMGRKKVLKERIRKIMLIFGGSDPSNLTSCVSNELLGLQENYEMDIVLGAHFVYENELNKVISRHDKKRGNIAIHRDVDNVPELMFDADLVIASPGLSVYESLCIGTPVIVFHQNLWQKNGFKGFIDTLGKDEVDRLGGLMAASDFVDPRAGSIREMSIGEGKTEIIEAIRGGR